MTVYELKFEICSKKKDVIDSVVERVLGYLTPQSEITIYLSRRILEREG